MITRQNKERDIIDNISADKTSLDIVDINGTKYYRYTCSFVINQIAAYLGGVRAAKVEIAYKRVYKNFRLFENKKETRPDVINNRIKNLQKIRKDFGERKDKEQSDNIIFSKSFDIFSKTKKVSFFRLRTAGPIDLERTVQTFSSLQPGDETRARAFASLRPSETKPSNLSSTSAYSNLILNGKDPGDIPQQDAGVISPARSRSGYGNVGRSRTNLFVDSTTPDDNSSRNLNTAQSAALQSDIVKNVTTKSEVPYNFLFPISKTPADGKITLIVTIQDANQQIIQKKNFILDHLFYLEKYNIPQKLPNFSAQKSNQSLMRANVFKKDQTIAGVDVFSREIKNFDTATSQRSYTKKADLTFVDGNTYITRKISQKMAGNVIVRSLPKLKSGITLGNFESKIFPQTTDVLPGFTYCFFNSGLVSVNIFGVPSGFKYIQILRKNVTKYQKNWEKIGNQIIVDDGIGLFVDNSTRPEQTYEYSAECQDKFGNKKQIAKSFVIRTTYTASNVQLTANLNSQSIIEDQSVRRFDVTISTRSKTSTSELLSGLTNQGTQAYYNAEFEKLSGDLDDVTKIAVKKINLSDGSVTPLGLVNSGSFTDASSDDAIYVFEGLSRGQADLFEEIGSKLTSNFQNDPRDATQRSKIVTSALTATKQIAKKNFTQKFLSKRSLLRGTLSYGATKGSLEDDEGFQDGRLGLATSIVVRETNAVITISNFKLVTASSSRRLLSFQISGSGINKIDFFLISTSIGGIRSVVGTCHCLGDKSVQYFLDNKTDVSNGFVQYIITPVLYGGSVVNETTSPNMSVR